MTITNQERVREFRGRSVHVQGGGLLKAVNLHIYTENMTIDALATIEASLEGQNFKYDGKCAKTLRSIGFYISVIVCVTIGFITTISILVKQLLKISIIV